MRFIVVPASEHKCCYSHSVVDTLLGKESYGDYWKKIICEGDEETCNYVAVALNEKYGSTIFIKSGTDYSTVLP